MIMRLAFIIVLISVNNVSGYKPVVLLHGILSAHEEMEVLAGYITSSHPGTVVHNIAMYEDSSSADTSMWTQLNGIVEKMKPVLTDPNGVHMICHSQGGLLCRAMIETVAGHNIQNFVSLSAPMMGQFGLTDYIRTIFPNYTEDHLYWVMYTKETQDHFSVSNYWHDPYHLKYYDEYCTFLTSMNNAVQPASKQNFLRLKNMVLVGGKDDGVITPWESSHFSFFGDDKMTVVPMKEQEVYLNDTFGLRTLDERGGVTIYSIDGVEHTHWRQNQSVFDCCIKPWLD